MADKDKAKVAQLQLLHQNLQALLVQKQHFQLQLNEVEAAQREVKTTSQAYKIVGNIMVQTPSAELEKDLNEKRESVELRLKNIDTQEERLRKKSEELQKQLMSELKSNG